MQVVAGGLKSGRQHHAADGGGDISINAGLLTNNNNSHMVVDGGEESSSLSAVSYPELKTPTGQQNANYITPTSGINQGIGKLKHSLTFAMYRYERPW